MAEGLLKALYGESYNVDSAGTEPSTINPYAIKVMKEIDIDISQHHSKSVHFFSGRTFDYVITVCDQAKETCPFFPGRIVIHKGFKDPAQAQGTEEAILAEFRKSRDEIKHWIEEAFKKRNILTSGENV